ncbi:MAG: hypothetical protein WCH57_00400 [Verrucomicrobiota bacterium]
MKHNHTSRRNGNQAGFPLREKRIFIKDGEEIRAITDIFWGFLVRADTNRVLASYDAMARAIEVYWSPDSRLVAVNEDISHATGHLSVWRLVTNHWKRVQLPELLQDRFVIDDPKAKEGHTEEVIGRFVRKEDAPMVKFWWGAHQPWAHRWLNDTDLEIGLGGEASLRNGRILGLDLLFVVRFEDDKSKILSQKQVHYEVKEE